jgi:hypothetical protein
LLLHLHAAPVDAFIEWLGALALGCSPCNLSFLFGDGGREDLVITFDEVDHKHCQ